MKQRRDATQEEQVKQQGIVQSQILIMGKLQRNIMEAISRQETGL